jgi:type I site-specific restriction endonuclease
MPPLCPDSSPYSETDTREKLINPVLADAGWTEDHIQRELSPGTILVDTAGRGQHDTERVDYLLCLPIRDGSIPLSIGVGRGKRRTASTFAPALQNAEKQKSQQYGFEHDLGVVEVKAANKPYRLGLQQAQSYAARLHIFFVFASNGHKCSFYNHFSGITRDVELDLFPSPAELRQLYEAHTGIHLDSTEVLPLLARYRGGQSARQYYQDAAIRTVLEALARGRRRMLLSMATGTGKTPAAAHLLVSSLMPGNCARPCSSATALALLSRPMRRSIGCLATMPRLSLGATKNIPLSLPPVTTQQEIVRRFARAQPVFNRFQVTAERQRTAIEALPAALLREIFVG